MKKKVNKSKKKKFKINWKKIFVWFALLVMVFFALAEIIAPLFYT